MIAFKFLVEYRDGREEEVQGDQYCVATWERWAAKNGLRASLDNPAPLAFTQIRVMAWAAHQRDATRKTPFEEWDAKVSEVRTPSGAPVDPTPAVTPAG